MLHGATLLPQVLSKRTFVLRERVVSSQNGYKLSQTEMLEQALIDLKKEKGLKLDDVIVKKVIIEHERPIAIVQVPTTLDPRSRYSEAVLDVIKQKLLKSGAGVVEVRPEVNPYIPSSKVSAENDRKKVTK